MSTPKVKTRGWTSLPYETYGLMQPSKQALDRMSVDMYRKEIHKNRKYEKVKN